MIYPAHDAYVAPARAHPQIWRLVLGFLLACAISTLWVIGLFVLVYLVAGIEGGPAWINRMTMADTPTSALLVIGTLWGLALGAMAATRALHRRSVWTLFGRLRRLRRGFFIAALACGVALALSSLIPFGYTPVANLGLGLWLNFLPLALVVILGQTLAEELFFRGYLQQQLAARFHSPLVWMLVPSALFGLAHFDPSNGPLLSWLTVAATGLFGLCAADLTARTGSIGAAWGFHFANNVAAILVVALSGSLSGLALYTTPFGPAEAGILAPLLARDMATTVVIWGVIRFILSRNAR
ncbi:CPBP family intramembrane glutamic endopeptidase [Nioella nitratireducens]|uniref:CPBP family intramembrane glutamic endopeptidase n=1 Tax=Nioella nitratireducens TaxID=1287720 RepID=UPI0008FD75CF|nr:type II CAAX endopeptidase family protein [Nioella nitratireducens]